MHVHAIVGSLFGSSKEPQASISLRWINWGILVRSFQAFVVRSKAQAHPFQTVGMTKPS